MKKKLLSQRILSGLGLIILCSNISFGQQVIGEFAVMDGGFEGQTAGNVTATAASTSAWTFSTPSSATKEIIDNSSQSRSGNKYFSFTSTGTSRMQSPLSNLAINTKYTVQYYFKAASDPTNKLTGAVYPGAIAADVAPPAVWVNGTSWYKAYATVTTNGTGTAATAFAAVRYGTSTYLGVLNVDDFVVYAGDVDIALPDAPSAPIVSGLNVSWTAPGTGVDGGGYVVVRYATSPNADNDPNQNGVYAVGNTITNGTGSLVGTVVFVGSGTSFTDSVTGFYKVYTVDKAFNYSAEVTTLKNNQWSLNNPISVYPNPVKDNQFSISLPASISGKVAVGIYNVAGQLVYKADATVSSNTIAVRPAQSLKSGVYVVKVENNGNSSTQKITVR
ncbi:MAG: T9SS type A sorting domain-containing protein [Flavobacterium sp.]|nr:T9SS type A sorting domain-containing protein [Flavobacterium sp.]